MDVTSLALSLFLIVPCQWVDTRIDDCVTGSGCIAGPYQPRQTRKYMVQAAAECRDGERPIPLGAKALLIRITATDATQAGHLTLYDATLYDMPLASALNFSPGKSVSNTLIIGLGQEVEGVPGGPPPRPDLAVTATTSGTVHVQMDLLGYFEEEE